MGEPDWAAAVRPLVARAGLDAAREAEVVDELAQHLESQFADLVAQGRSEAEARRQLTADLDEGAGFPQTLRALPSFHPPRPPVLGARPAARRSTMLDKLGLGSFRHDLKAALRGLRLKPAFSAMVIVMLALGIGGTSAVFSIYNGLFLRPWPFPGLDRLVDLDETAPRWNLEFVSVSNPDYAAWEAGNTTFEAMAFSFSRGVNLTTPDGATLRVEGTRVTHRMLEVLKLQPALGRGFLPEEDQLNGPRVAMLGHGLWHRVFQGDPGVVGRPLKIDGEIYTVVGVLPREAVYPARAELWVPLAVDTTQGGSFYLSGIGRLKPGVSVAQAKADLERVHRHQAEANRDEDHATSPIVTPLRERHLGDFRTATYLLLGGVAMLLLIACANVSGLTMVRASSRAREIAIRTAMGAARGAIVRQLLIEGLLLAAIGAVLGVALGAFALKALLRLVPDLLPAWIGFPLDLRAALFCAAITGAAVALFGLAPALEAARVDARECLQEGGRGGWSRGRRNTLAALIVGEVALTVLLLVASSVLVASLANVRASDPGLEPEGVLAFRVWPPESRYPDEAARIAFYDRLLAELRALPGVESAGAGSKLPVAEHNGWFASVEGGWTPGPEETNPVVLEVAATPGYLETLGVTLLAGRDLTELDGHDDASRVAIVNESFVKQFWPAGDGLGKRLRYGATGADFIPVVGITRDVKHYGLDRPMRPSLYVPYRQRGYESMGIVLRSPRDPLQLVAPARQVLARLDPELPMGDVRTLAERLDRSLWFRLAYSWLLWVFTAVSIVLAAAGVYSVTSFAVAQRTREIGIRMALGAEPRQVLARVMGNGLGLIATGAALGLVVSWFATKLLDSLLFGVSAHDPAAYAAVLAIVLAVGTLAGFRPARRAAAVDPVETLRAD